MKIENKFLSARIVLPALLLALVAWPQGAQAQLGGAEIEVTSGVVGGPHVDTVIVGDGIELQHDDGTNVDEFFGPGDSIDIGQNTITIELGEHMQGGFRFTNLDGPLDRDILGLSLSGSLSSESHLVFENDVHAASLTIDCNPNLGCNGGTLVLTITFAPIAGGEPIPAIGELRAAVVAQEFDAETEEKLTRRLDTAVSQA